RDEDSLADRRRRIALAVRLRPRPRNRLRAHRETPQNRLRSGGVTHRTSRARSTRKGGTSKVAFPWDAVERATTAPVAGSIHSANGRPRGVASVILTFPAAAGSPKRCRYAAVNRGDCSP